MTCEGGSGDVAVSPLDDPTNECTLFPFCRFAIRVAYHRASAFGSSLRNVDVTAKHVVARLKPGALPPSSHAAACWSGITSEVVNELAYLPNCGL